MQVKCLTVLQPYAHLIINGDRCSRIKDIENRTWETRHRGRLYIHAGQKYHERWHEIRQDLGLRLLDSHVAIDQQRGHIIGYVDLVDCVLSSRSMWFEGPVGWVIRRPVKIDPIPYKGLQRIWNADIPDPS